MRKVTAFNFITLDGYYKDYNEGIHWHKHGTEEANLSAENLRLDNILLFGRVTYEMMSNFWTTPMAYESFPVVAEGMNNAEKIVFSKSIQNVMWTNTSIIREDIVNKIKALKKQPGKDLTILGSGSILTQFASADIIDEYQIMIDPVAIGNGTAIFKNISHQLNLKLTSTRTFKSGVILLYYEPA